MVLIRIRKALMLIRQNAADPSEARSTKLVGTIVFSPVLCSRKYFFRIRIRNPEFRIRIQEEKNFFLWILINGKDPKSDPEVDPVP